MKVAIIRFSSIGDIILTTPIVQAVKEQLNAEITFFTSEKYKSVVLNDKLVDNVWGKVDLETKRDLSFDYIIDLQKNRRSFLLSRRLKGKYITFDKLNVKKWMLTSFGLDFMPKRHLIDRYFDALQSINIVNNGYALRYNIPKSISVDSLPISFVAINCGGTYYTKRIPSTVIHNIVKKEKKPCLLLGGKDVIYVEQDFNNNNNVISLIDKLTLEESAFVISQSDVFYSSDSALMHIGAALDVDMKVMWGSTSPQFGMFPYKTSGAKADVRNLEVPNLGCRPCSKFGYAKCPKGHFKCMRDQE